MSTAITAPAQIPTMISDYTNGTQSKRLRLFIVRSSLIKLGKNNYLLL